MHTTPRDLCLTALAIISLAVLALWPVFSPGMSADDYGLQVYARLTRSPLTFFLEDHTASYAYRPVTMLLWWLVAQAGPEATLQYAMNIALHALNALLVGALAWRWTGRWQAMLLAGVIFAVHPAISATPMWLADRFDLSATLGILAALMLLERAIERGRSGWLLPLAAFWAIGSKEIGVALVVLAALRLLVAPTLSLPLRARLAGAVILPVGLTLLARGLLLRSFDQTLGIPDPAHAAATGIGAWWQLWPTALGLGGPVSTAWLLPLLLLAALYGWARRPQVSTGARPTAAAIVVPTVRIPLLLLLGGVLLLPSLVQWPVTQLVLVAPDALANPANLRFYYLAFVAVAVFIGVGLARINATLALAAGILVAVSAVPVARGQARDWAAMTAENDRPVAAALNALAAEPVINGLCVVQFSGLDAWADHTHFFDSAIKARLAPDSPWLRCLYLTREVPWYSVQPRACDDAELAPLRPRDSAAGVMHARRFGSLCVIYPALPVPAQIEGSGGRWQWTGEGFRR
jgi:hypothetical protein